MNARSWAVAPSREAYRAPAGPIVWATGWPAVAQTHRNPPQTAGNPERVWLRESLQIAPIVLVFGVP